MKIVINQNKMLRSSSDMLELSRTVRRLGSEVKEAERQLRRYSSLDKCRYDLIRQTEAIETITGRLVNLSTSLREITEAYTIAEERNENMLEEVSAFRTGAEKGRVYEGSYVHDKVRSILR